MKKYPAILNAILAIALLALAGFSAADSLDQSQPLTSPSGIRYITGGVGDQSRQRMDALRKDYNLLLTFAHPSGEYLADVTVSILSAKQDITLNAVSPGPLFFAELPDGRYTINATFNGKQKSYKVLIGGGRSKELVYYFPKE